MLSGDLSWTDHVTMVSQKVHRSLYSLRHFKHLMPEDLKAKLIQTLIFPIFDYCDTVYQDLSVEQAGRLQRLQNSCVRFVLNLKYRDHVSPVMRRLGWLKLVNRRKLHMALLTFKILSTNSPEYLFTRFSYLSSSSYNTRTTDLHIQLSHSQSLHSSFNLSASRLWNSFPESLRTSTSITSFKNQIVPYLLTSQVE